MRGSLYRPTYFASGPHAAACQGPDRARHTWIPIAEGKRPTAWRCSRCGATRKQSTVWWARYSRGGRVIRESTECTERRKAEDFLNTRLDPAKPVLPRADRVLVDELLDDYVAAYKAKHRATGCRGLGFVEQCVARLKEFFAGWRASRITVTALNSYIAFRQASEYRKGKTFSNASVNRHLAVLRAALRLARRTGKLLVVPDFERLQERPPRQGFVGDVDFLALEAALPEYLRLPIAFKFTYGWRKRSVISLGWDRVNLHEGTVQLDAMYSKNHDPTTVYLTAELLARFRAQWEATCNLVRKRISGATPQQVRAEVPFVFHRRGRRIVDFKRAWKKAVKAIGRPELTPHDLRRSAARRMDRLGIPRSVAMAMAGWRTPSIYARYRIIDQEDLKEASVKLGAGAFAFPLPPEAREAATTSPPSRPSQ